MQTCHKCQIYDHPDTAVQCYRCRRPLKKSRSRFRNLNLLQASDLAVLGDHLLETKGATDTTAAAPLLIAAILIFLGSFLFFLLPGGSGKPVVNGSRKLTVSDSNISFNAPTITISQNRTFFISNTGNVPLHWRSILPPNTPWLSLQPSSGTLSGNKSQLAILSVDSTHSLPPTQSYKNFIQISSDGGTRSVDIVMNTIAPTPSLSITPASLSFHDIIQGTSKTHLLHLTNMGKQALHWNVASLPAWMSLAPRQNDTLPPLQSEDLMLTINTNLPSQQNKTLATSLPFTYDGNRTLTIPVQATITPPPANPYLCINLTDIDMGTLPAGKSGTKMLELRNCGTGGALHWNITKDASWISTTPSSNPTNLLTDAAQLVALHYDTSELHDGTYQATLTVQSSTNKLTVTIRLAVHTPRPILCNFTQKFDFGTMLSNEKSTQLIRFQNCGDAQLQYQFRTPAWIHSSSSKTTLDQQQAGTIPFEIDPSSLTPGTYTPTLYITSKDGGEAAISTTLQVLKSAELLPTQLDFGDRTQNEPASLPLPLHNNGDIPLTWHIALLDASWINVQQYDGTIPPHGQQAIQVDAITNSLSPDQPYKTTIALTYNNKTSDIPVSIYVLPPPKLCTTPDPASMPITLQQQQSRHTTFQGYNCGGAGALAWDINNFELYSTDNQNTFRSHASVSKQEGDIVGITIDAYSTDAASLLPVGSYTLTITFSDPNKSSIDIPVTITPAPSPCIQPPATSDPVTVTSGQRLVMALPVYNCGGSSVTGTVYWSKPTARIEATGRATSIHSFTLPTSFQPYDEGIGITIDTGSDRTTALSVGYYRLSLAIGSKNFPHILTFHVIEASPPITPTPTVNPTPTETPTVNPTPTDIPTVDPTPTDIPTVDPTPTDIPTVDPTTTPGIYP